MRLKTKILKIIKQQSENRISWLNNYIAQIYNLRAGVVSGKD